MNYVYPKLSEHDLMLFRLGGAGLGNILFTYARAVVFARKYNFRMIWPTWPSLRIGPILRNEKDKRFYNNLFSNNSEYVDGLKKCRILLTKRKITEQKALEYIVDGKQFDDAVVEFEGFEDCFLPILYDSPQISEDILNNLKKRIGKLCLLNLGMPFVSISDWVIFTVSRKKKCWLENTTVQSL